MEATGTRLTSARCVRPLQAAAADTHNAMRMTLGSYEVILWESRALGLQ